MILRFLVFCTKMLLLCSVIGVMIAGYSIYYYSRDLPDYSQLEKYYPPLITRIYSSDAKLMEEYARERRIFVPINSVPKSLVEAFIAAEDKNFYNHEGIDLVSIIRAAINNISRIINHRRVEGGSTITQQVVKNFLLTSERSLERKIKEAILAYMLTQTFTKDQILELYLNQIYLGKGAYGVATAALHYFNKSVEELTLNESAVLASLPKAPSKYNPERDYDRAVERKNYVLGRMYEDGYITEEQAREAISEPITLVKFDKVQTLDADFYAEKVRDEVIGMFGEEYFYTAGLTIFTCADSKMQNAAASALRSGIKKYDYKRGYRGALRNIDIEDWNNNLRALPRPIGLRHYQLAVILEVKDDQAQIGLKDNITSHIFLEDMEWTATNLKSIHKLLKVGDVIAVEKLPNKYILQQIPQLNGGIMVVEHKTGRVLASEGGYDFDMSKFDRTTQAKRQPGSLIKPFVYLSAIEKGAKPTDIFEDAPIEIEQGPGLPLWQPRNYENNFLGPITMRQGLEKSRNTVTVRVGQFAGWDNIGEIIKRFGINDNPMILPSMVLGSLETTLSKMTLAYSIIANNGRMVEPHYIEMIKDSRGNVIYKRDYTECPECKSYLLDEEGEILPPKVNIEKGKEIIDEASDYQIISLMMGSAQRGTSRRANGIKQIMAGKTGTTNQAKDAWFMGFTPKVVVGTYVGYDNPRSLGKYATGASIALPIFVDFMNNGYKDEPSVDFIVPDSINLAMVDYDTGTLSTKKGAIIEALKVDKPKHVESDKQEDIKLEVEEPEPEPEILPEKEKENIDPFDKIQDQDSSQELY